MEIFDLTNGARPEAFNARLDSSHDEL